MQLSYNGYRIDRLGDLSIEQNREYEGEAPQRAKVRFKVIVETFYPSVVSKN